MGLDTTHGCWNGPYSSFNRWRTAVCKAAGLGNLDEYEGFGGDKKWAKDDVLTELLYHSDCDGELEWKICDKLADRLEALLPELAEEPDAQYCYNKAKLFIDGLRLAFESKENVIFQ